MELESLRRYVVRPEAIISSKYMYM